MKKHILMLVLVISWLFSPSKADSIHADWWQRPSAQPTQPSFDRNLPTPSVVVHPTFSISPTVTPNIPTVLEPSVTPRIGEPTTVPTQETSGGSSSTSGNGGDPCDPGKPFVGPYCGWSPNVNNSSTGSGDSGGQPRIGGPQVLGLSNTSGSDLALSDIMILAGILCLSVYVKSKTALDNLH